MFIFSKAKLIMLYLFFHWNLLWSIKFIRFYLLWLHATIGYWIANNIQLPSVFFLFHIGKISTQGNIAYKRIVWIDLVIYHVFCLLKLMLADELRNAGDSKSWLIHALKHCSEERTSVELELCKLMIERINFSEMLS